MATDQGEGVGHIPVWGQLGPEAVGWEELVAVVVLDDVPHRLQGHSVGVHLVRAHVVQRGGLRGVPWGHTQSHM